MEPTYSFSEVMQMLKDLQKDQNTLNMLFKLVDEEKKRYCLRDLELIMFYSKILKMNFKNY